MSDVRERLLNAGSIYPIDLLRKEAAAEIERLEAENQDLIVSNTTLDKSNLEMRAEIERLRAELNNAITAKGVSDLEIERLWAARQLLGDVLDTTKIEHQRICRTRSSGCMRPLKSVENSKTRAINSAGRC